MPNKNMIKPFYFLLCEKMVVDQTSNNVTAMNITEQLNITTEASGDEIKKTMKEKSFISVPVTMTLLSVWSFEKNPNSFKLKLTIKDPSGKDLLCEEKPIEITDRKKYRQRINQVLNSFPVSMEGIYTIEVVLTVGKDVSIQRTYLDVKAPFLK